MNLILISSKKTFIESLPTGPTQNTMAACMKMPVGDGSQKVSAHFSCEERGQTFQASISHPGLLASFTLSNTAGFSCEKEESFVLSNPFFKNLLEVGEWIIEEDGIFDKRDTVAKKEGVYIDHVLFAPPEAHYDQFQWIPL